MSAAELDLLLGALSTSREGRLSNEDRFRIQNENHEEYKDNDHDYEDDCEYLDPRLFMSIPPSPASAAKKPSSGDQVVGVWMIVMIMEKYGGGVTPFPPLDVNLLRTIWDTTQKMIFVNTKNIFRS